MEVRHQAQLSGPSRPAHAVLRDLVGGLDLSPVALGRRPDKESVGLLVQMFANAEYWLSFEVASFEPLLARTPSPLRELGVAIALRFGDGVDGMLSAGDVSRARDVLLPKLPDDLKAGLERALATLERGIRARDHVAVVEEAGLRKHTAAQSLSVHALRAMGRSQIAIAGYADDEKKIEFQLGKELVLSATDEKGRPLPPPEIESNLEAPLYSKDDAAANQRTIFLFVPGEYLVRVAGRATGDRKILAF